MTTQLPIIKNDAGGAIVYTALVSQANPAVFQAAPSLAAGDVKISIDGAAFANLATLPTVTPAAGKDVKIVFSQAETNGDNLVVVFSDAAGAEWCDQIIHVQTAARHFDDHAFPTVSGRAFDVDAAGGIEVGSFQAGAITAAAFTAGAIDANAIATDAIGSAELAASAVTEIQTGLATAAALDAIPTNAELAIALAAADDAVLAQVALVKAKTDNLPPDPADASDVGAAFAVVNAKLPAALVGGRMDASVGAMATDVITAAAIAVDAIGASELAASAVTEIQTGLATAAALVTLQADTDDIQTRLPAALVSGRMDASIGAVATTTNLGFTVPAMARGTVASGATTTSLPTSAFAPAGSSVDQFVGRSVLFDGNTATAGLRACARPISASSMAGLPTLTVDALPTTPAAGDTFSVI